MSFLDRRDAGRQLAARLEHLQGIPDLLVLALPRGGVPVGLEVARALDAPLDVLLVRKLGLPGQEELAMGAIASGGARVLNADVVATLHIPSHIIDAVARREERELVRREAAYRGNRPFPSIRGRTVIIVDDGIATGSSMAAAVRALQAQQPARLIVAAPIIPLDTLEWLEPLVDEVACVVSPRALDGVGAWYNDFSQTSDAEVRACLVASEQPVGQGMKTAGIQAGTVEPLLHGSAARAMTE